MTKPNEPEGLELCPFCGSEAKIERSAFSMVQVRCTECVCGTGLYADDQVGRRNAIAAWNRRVHAKPVADAGGVTEDDVIGLINVVIDLAEVDALDKAYPEVWGRLNAVVDRAVVAATAAKDAEIARLRDALLTINAIAAVQIGGSAQGNEAALKMLHDKTEAALSEAREAGHERS